MTLPTRMIGDLTVSAVGLGCMPMSFEDMIDHRERAIETIHRALDLGITMLDTANIYAPTWDTVGHNESLVAEALRAYTGTADVGSLLVTTKGGLTRGPGESWGRDSSAAGLRSACEASLTALGVDVIDLYQHHRHDPEYTYLAQMQSLAALQDAGLVRRVGLSNVNLAELELALEVIGGPRDGGIVSVQNEFSPRYRGDADVLDRCGELGIAFLPWSPLGGSTQAHDIGSHYAEFARVGEELDATPQETVIAWLLAISPVMIPIPGATRPATVESIVRALALSLTDDQISRLSATLPAMESMYPDDLPRSLLR
ncbi:MAG: aldo/keto reductase [Actinobacteria bacterium]|nr:aldo/keto reductase [Actinomycetota bacterium]